MIEKLSGIKLNIGKDESALVRIAEKKLGVKPSYFRILKKSLDARNKNDIFLTYSIEFSSDEFPPKEEIARVPEKNLPSDPRRSVRTQLRRSPYRLRHKADSSGARRPG